MRPVWYLSVGCLALAFTLQWSFAEEAKPSVRKKLVEMWAAERSAIVTGHFKFRFIRLSADRLADPSISKIERALASVDLLASPDQMRLLYDRIVRTPGKSPSPWGLMTLDIDGQRLREECHLANSGNPIVQTSVYNGTEKLEADSATKQILVSKGKTNRIDLRVSDLRFVPPIIDLAPHTFSVTKDIQGQILIKAGGSELMVDEDTGFVRHCVSRTPEGRVTTDTFQYGPVTYPGGIVFPTASVRILCTTNGEVSQIAIAVIEETVLNQPIKDEVFRVAATKGRVIVDATNSVSPSAFRLSRAVGDVAKSIEDGSAQPKKRIPSKTNNSENVKRVLSKSESDDIQKHTAPGDQSRRWGFVSCVGLAIVFLGCGLLTWRHWCRKQVRLGEHDRKC